MSKNKSPGWIGVDLDGTLAYHKVGDFGDIGAPILPIVDAVKKAHAEGVEIRIVTARAFGGLTEDGNPFVNKLEVTRVQDWCEKHLGFKPLVTFWKDFQMMELWDDRAIQIVPNEGISVAQAGARLARIGEKLYLWAVKHGGSAPPQAWLEFAEALGIPPQAPTEESRIQAARSVPEWVRKKLTRKPR